MVVNMLLIILLMGLLRRYRSRLRNRQVRCRYLLHGCDEPRPRHEMYHSRGHGWCARYLRAYRRCHYPGIKYVVTTNSHILMFVLLIVRACMFVCAVITPSVTGSTKYSSFTGYAHLSAGLCCGLR
jgi:hypothetical protein